jgi:hypothetical protein
MRAYDLIKPRVSLFFCPQMNVSREEYERMYQVYLQSVEMQRLQEEAEDEPARAQPQTFHSIQNEPSAGESQKFSTLFKIRRCASEKYSFQRRHPPLGIFIAFFILRTPRQICL